MIVMYARGGGRCCTVMLTEQAYVLFTSGCTGCETFLWCGQGCYSIIKQCLAVRQPDTPGAKESQYCCVQHACLAVHHKQKGCGFVHYTPPVQRLVACDPLR